MPPPPQFPQPPVEGGAPNNNHNHLAHLMRQIQGIREQAHAVNRAREARQARDARPAGREGAPPRAADRNAARRDGGARDQSGDQPRPAQPDQNNNSDFNI
jgi:hypothetical protein